MAGKAENLSLCGYSFGGSTSLAMVSDEENASKAFVSFL